ncbi:MAG TPA: hypothetical protein VMW56_28000 [Candidatus Margulisiibacteriota bacterium]|nr:hypothetical protein [Candidatus Margulisiibacteriota bacterium]
MHQPASVAAPAPVGFLRTVWERWKKIARAIGVVQTRILMVVFYFLFVLPIGLLMRMRGDPLHLKEPQGSNWTPHRSQDANLETARRQF